MSYSYACPRRRHHHKIEGHQYPVSPSNLWQKAKYIIVEYSQTRPSNHGTLVYRNAYAVLSIRLEGSDAKTTRMTAVALLVMLPQTPLAGLGVEKVRIIGPLNKFEKSMCSSSQGPSLKGRVQTSSQNQAAAISLRHPPHFPRTLPSPLISSLTLPQLWQLGSLKDRGLSGW